MTTVTLDLDEALLHRATTYATAKGRSVESLLTAFLAVLPEDPAAIPTRDEWAAELLAVAEHAYFSSGIRRPLREEIYRF